MVQLLENYQIEEFLFLPLKKLQQLHLKKKDYAFLITRYAGRRNSAAIGLRHCDIDLENKTITFTNWEKVVTYKKIRGGKRRENQVRRLKTSKDERTIPMSTKLYEKIKDIPFK